MQGKRLIAYRLESGAVPVVRWYHTDDFARPVRSHSWDSSDPAQLYTNSQTTVEMDDWRGLFGLEVHVQTSLGAQALQRLHALAKQHSVRAFYGFCTNSMSALFDVGGVVMTEKELEAGNG